MSSALIKTILLLLVLLSISFVIGCIITYVMVYDEEDGSDKMQKEKALKKLQKAKQEALANSAEIRVGRLELNEAMKALRTIIALQNILKNE